MTKLSVNINKIATLRNARGGDIPNVCRVAMDCELFGADGITVHPRPDERHIRYQDVRDLRPLVSTEFNIEGNPAPEFIRLVKEVKPQQVTLVPDAHNDITSNAGWDTVAHFDFLKNITEQFHESGIRVSIFVDSEIKHLEYAKLAGADRIELYTEPYASQYAANRDNAIRPFVAAAEYAHKIGLGINAGHDLSLKNLKFLKQQIPMLAEVSIGHALIADALYFGLENTIKQYKMQLI
ncbi:MAG: pyridoxine 5'-phosphate synthase [Paludibacter sp.]|jgi:pyridoxine 5-phosphate synthase|nr:pyridoxine 5'-phosphate synthase [Paludibacter sp.]